VRGEQEVEGSGAKGVGDGLGCCQCGSDRSAGVGLAAMIQSEQGSAREAGDDTGADQGQV